MAAAVIRAASSCALAAYSHYVSVRRNRVVAHVRTAVALTPAQQQNLIAALGKAIGKTVHINVEVDPKVLGGKFNWSKQDINRLWYARHKHDLFWVRQDAFVLNCYIMENYKGKDCEHIWE